MRIHSKRYTSNQIIRQDDVHTLFIYFKIIKEQNFSSFVEFASLCGSYDCLKFLSLNIRDGNMKQQRQQQFIQKMGESNNCYISYRTWFR